MRKVLILISIVIFLGVGYMARFALAMDEVVMISYQLLTYTHDSSPANCFVLGERHVSMNFVANDLLNFNAAFVALIYALLDSQFAHDMLKEILKVLRVFVLESREEQAEVQERRAMINTQIVTV